MTQEELYKSLRNRVFEEIQNRHCKIDDNAIHQLEGIIRFGVNRMTVDERHSGAKIAEAQHNALRMANYICSQINTYGIGGRIQARMINESLVNEARLRICPIWPFC